MNGLLSLMMAAMFLCSGGIITSAEGRNTSVTNTSSDVESQEAPESSEVMSNLGSRNYTSPRCRDICECFSESMSNMSVNPACFRVKGNSSHLVKQMLQDNINEKTCEDAVGDTTRFRCEGNKMMCIYIGSESHLKPDTPEEQSMYSLASPINASDQRSSSFDKTNTYTYVTCDRHSEGSIISCRIDKNSTRPGTCTKESLAKCHYKSAGNKQKNSSKRDNKVSRDERCPHGWSFRRKRCHRRVNDPTTFDQAITKCRHMGAFLTLRSKHLSEEALPLDWGEGVHWAENKSGVNGNSECVVANSSHSMWDYNNTSCLDSHQFYCYKEVFKFLQCKPVPEAIPLEPTDEVTTEMVTTMDSKSMTTMTAPSTSPTTTPTTMQPRPPAPVASSPEEKLNNARVALREAKVKIEDFVSKITNDSSTLDILNDLIDAPPMVAQEEPGNNDAAVTMVTEMVEKMDSLVDSLAEMVTGPMKPLNIEQDHLVLKVLPICSTCSSTSSGPELKAGINNDSYVINIPSSAVGGGATAAISALSSIEDVMSANVVDDDEETTSSSGNQSAITHEIVSLVATVSVKKWDGSDLELEADHPFEIVFTNKASASPLEESSHSCCFWQPDKFVKGEGAWSTEGCVTSRNHTHTTCQCTHLTSFAVLMRISKAGEPQSSHVSKIQDYMTYVGCGMSMTCLATMLLVFTIQKLYRSDRNIIHMNLASALLISQGVFLFGIDRVEIWQVCKTIGICLHFFLLSTFFWMLVEGIYLISKTTSTKNKFLSVPTYIAIGWGLPAIIVGVTAGVSFKTTYTTDKICWLSNENGGIWAFVGPAIGIIMLNISLLCQVIRVFLTLKANMKKAHVERIWLALRAMLLTLPLLGGTWLFGILSFNSQTIFFSYIFIILNSLQGVFIFVLYCVMNDEVKKVVEKKLSSISRISGRASNGRSTKSTT